MSRILAREDCFKLMFEYEFLKQKNDVSLSGYLEDENLTEDEKDYVKQEYDGLLQKSDALDEIISKYLKGYTLTRIFKVDLAILKVATYEMLFSPLNTPKEVIINEAVELAKKYSTEKSYSFVNGVLASICRGESDGKATD
jgi:N utilization substance protein B